MNLTDRTIGVASVGCSVFAYDYFNVDFRRVAARPRACRGDGRAPRATGQVRLHVPGDGDLAAIGTAEIVHAARAASSSRRYS